MLQRSTSRGLKQGEILMREGEVPENEMYFILSGEVGIYKQRPSGDHLIETLRQGQFFGEMALVGQQTRLATAKAHTDVRLIVIDRATFMKLCGSNPQFIFNLLKYAITRLLAAEDNLQQINEEIHGQGSR